MPASDAAHTAQYAKMTGTPIPKLVVTLAIPTIISMMTTAIYNMADTFLFLSSAPVPPERSESSSRSWRSFRRSALCWAWGQAV